MLFLLKRDLARPKIRALNALPPKVLKEIAKLDLSALRSMSIENKQSVPGAVGRLLPSFESVWQTMRQATRNAREFAGSQFQFFAGMNRLLSLFYKSILHDTPVPISYAEILRVSQIMDEISAQVYPVRLA